MHESKAKIFPLTTRLCGKPPSREDLYWLRDHLIKMTNGLNNASNPYVYMSLCVDGVKLRSMVADINTARLSLWPVGFTTNLRITASRRALKTLRSSLHIILKVYPK